MTGHRIALTAVHVAAAAGRHPGEAARIDWDATLALRHRLWGLGLGVAEAMDTAQRGSALHWPAARELIIRTGRETRAARRAAGAHRGRGRPDGADGQPRAGGGGPRPGRLPRRVRPSPPGITGPEWRSAAWLACCQDHFVMLGRAGRGRSPVHLAGLLPLAEDAGILPGPDLARHRLRSYLAGRAAWARPRSWTATGGTSPSRAALSRHGAAQRRST